MSAIEDRLRSVLDERARGGALDPEPYAHVRRRIRRTQRRRAAAAGGAAALVAVAAFVGASIGGGSSHERPAGPSASATIRSMPGNGDSGGEGVVVLSRQGLTVGVRCDGTAGELAVLVGGHWVTGYRCGEHAPGSTASFAVPSRRYPALGLAAGGPAEVVVEAADFTKGGWTVTAAPGVPARPVVPIPRPRGPLATPPRTVLSLSPSDVTPDRAEVTFTLPDADIAVRIDCIGPGDVSVELTRDGDVGDVVATSRCPGVLRPTSTTTVIKRAAFGEWGLAAGARTRLFVSTFGFRALTWKVSVVRR